MALNESRLGESEAVSCRNTIKKNKLLVRVTYRDALTMDHRDNTLDHFVRDVTFVTLTLIGESISFLFDHRRIDHRFP